MENKIKFISIMFSTVIIDLIINFGLFTSLFFLYAIFKTIQNKNNYLLLILSITGLILINISSVEIDNNLKKEAEKILISEKSKDNVIIYKKYNKEFYVYNLKDSSYITVRGFNFKEMRFENKSGL